MLRSLILIPILFHYLRRSKIVDKNGKVATEIINSTL